MSQRADVTATLPSVGTERELTPLQQATLDAIRLGPMTFDQHALDALGDDVDRALHELTALLAADEGIPRQLHVSKWALAEVLSCERSWLASEQARAAATDDFAWSTATARGTISHKAIQLSIHWPGTPVSGHLVDRAVELLGDTDGSIADWLRNLADYERAELRSWVVERVDRFLECFPPLKANWRPVTEGRSRYPANGAITLHAKPDLTIGTAEGAMSRKAVIDLKSGPSRAVHRDDLRFYALVETLTRRTPPRVLVGYSLEACRPETEEVSMATLRSAARRTLDAIERMIALRDDGDTPTGCARRWCTVCAPAPAIPDD